MDLKKSRQLSKILRHAPDSVGLTLDSAGWCEVSKLLVAMKMIQEELDFVIENNNKKRFEYNSDKSKIRASQGHSVEVELDYKPTEPPEFLWHGTSADLVGVLKTTGISKMKRHAVHLSADKDTAIAVGKRKGIPVALKIHAGQMHKTGYKFYLSTNGVWLVDNVPPRYICETSTKK